jgi:hypothetical protein
LKAGSVSVDAALAAARPPSRNSEAPDAQAGVKVSLGNWKGLHTAGSTGTAVDGLAFGVSGVARHFVVPALIGSGQRQTNGWGLSFDALVPLVPASLEHRANALTLTASFVTGSGISDLYTGLTGGIAFPVPPNPDMVTPAPTYQADIDNGMVTFDANGRLHSIDWQSLIVGIQYYFPPSGRVWVSANYSRMRSGNATQYVTESSASKVFAKSYWADANVFCDLSSAVRLGAEYAYFHQTYADGVAAKNTRLQFSGFYLF